MEYSLLRTIETPLGYFDPITSLLQSPYQSVDFVNPGLGGLARLYDVYVPIHYMSPPHCSNKIITDQQGFGSTVVSSDQGQSNPNIFFSNENGKSGAETQDLNSSFESKKEESQDDNKERDNLKIPSVKDIPNDETQEGIAFDKKFNNENDKKRKLLGDKVFEAFMHPMVKTAKISLKNEGKNSGSKTSIQTNLSPEEKKNSPRSTTSKHKFKVI